MPLSEPALRAPLPLLALAAWMAASPAPPALGGEPFPIGERLRPRVEFWVQIYSRITTDQAVFHDADDPNIVYQIVGLEGRQESRDIERFLRPIGQRYEEVLRDLAAGLPPRPGSDEERVLKHFGPGVTPERLRRASENVRFQRGQADVFLEGLVRRGAYEEHLRRIFAAEGLPYDLTYLPHVESSFRPQAYSRSGAAGIWQFTRSTGRHYMQIGSMVDERWDPIDATGAAARLLKHNYQELHNWPLAITAYNHGLEGMKRAVARLGTFDLEEIIDRYDGRAFGFASKNFYSEFLAAREVASHAERYFGAVPRWEPLRFQELRLDRPAPATDLMRALGMSSCDLAHYNPALRAPALLGERPLPAGLRLKVPAGIVPEGASVAGLLEVLKRPSLRAAAPAEIAARPGASLPPSSRQKPAIRQAEAATPPWIASLAGIPSPGPAGRGALFLLDSALLWGRAPGPVPPSPPLPPGSPPTPTLPGTAPAPTGALPAVQAAAGAPPGVRAQAPGPVSSGDTGSSAVSVAASPWRTLGTELPLSVRFHPDWAPWMREIPPVGLPPAPFLAALEVKEGRIQVEPEENLALVAFWLRLSVSRLRELNGLHPGQPLRVGQWLKVDFSRVPQPDFVGRRRGYQQELASGFLRDHRVTSTQLHEVRPGETLWSIARRYGRLPLWLLRWYNEGTEWLEPSPGSQVVVPVVERYSS